jgi:hypothetical protein
MTTVNMSFDRARVDELKQRLVKVLEWESLTDCQIGFGVAPVAVELGKEALPTLSR